MAEGDVGGSGWVAPAAIVMRFAEGAAVVVGFAEAAVVDMS